MIKLALKHWIYERCIDFLFDTISNNFTYAEISNNLKEGDTYSKIYFDDGDSMENAFVEKIYIAIEGNVGELYVDLSSSEPGEAYIMESSGPVSGIVGVLK